MSWLNHDIISILNQFITDFDTLFNLRKTCRIFLCHEFKNIDLTTHNNKLIYIFKNVIKITLGPNLYYTADNDYGIYTNYKNKTSFKINDKPFTKYKNITYLDCGDTHNLTDGTISCLQSLTHLDCGRNKFTDKIIHKFPNLTHLSCGHARHNLPIQFFCNYKDISFMLQYRVIRPLKVVGEYTHFTDNAVGTLKNLTYLDCGYNKFTDAVLSKLPNLTHLLCGHHIIFSDIHITRLTKLTYLECDTHMFSDFAIKRLVNLTYLSLGYGNSCFTYNGLKHLTNLRELHCISELLFYDFFMLDKSVKSCVLTDFPNLVKISNKIRIFVIRDTPRYYKITPLSHCLNRFKYN